MPLGLVHLVQEIFLVVLVDDGEDAVVGGFARVLVDVFGGEDVVASELGA